jgi:hypothetical protein
MIRGHAFCTPGNHIALEMERLIAEMAMVGSANEHRTLKLLLDLFREDFIHFRDTLFMEEIRAIFNSTLYHRRYVIMNR